MMLVDWLALMLAHPIFAELGEEDVRALLDHAQERTFSSEDLIVRAGEIGNSLFVVGSGTAAVMLTDNGRSIPVALMRKGEIFGEMAFFEPRSRSASVIARERCVVLEIGRSGLLAVLHRHSEVELKLLLKISERLRETNEHLLAISRPDSSLMDELARLCPVIRTQAKVLTRPWGIYYASLLNLLWALCVLMAPNSVRHISAIHVWGDELPLPLLLILLSGAGALALFALQFSGLTRLAMMLPQQMLLLLAAMGSLQAVVLGQYAHGYAAPSMFILADQAPILLVAIFYTINCVDLARRRSNAA